MIDEEFTQERLDHLDEIIRQQESRAQQLAVTSLDANPEDGARALQLSQATGIPPTAVYNDIEGTERAHRASLLSEMFENNPHLTEYVQGNPLADVVSNDDYGNMDKFSRTVPGAGLLDSVVHSAVKGYLNWESPVTAAFKGAVSGAATAAIEGFGKTPIPQEDVEAWDKANPVLKFFYGGKDLGRAITAAFMGGIAGGVTGGIRGFGENVGVGDTEIGQLERDAMGMLEDAGMRLGDYAGPIGGAIGENRLMDQLNQARAFEDAANAQVRGMNRGLTASIDWAESEMEPPTGYHPDIDAIKADVNAKAVEALDANLGAALEMATRERSPEHAEAFIRQSYGSHTLGIPSDRIAQLYGDRVPSPDDGLLGWAPDLAEKLAAARITGDDVHIPLVDWMGKVDPAVAWELKPDVRVWPGGITQMEAAEPKVEPNHVDAPLPAMRNAMGLEPLFGPIGDKKLTLRQEGGDETFHKFKFDDETGKPVGDLMIMPDPENKTLWVANINGLAGLYSNSFGPSLIRDLKKQLKAFYPEYEWVQGHRVSGAREAAGTQYDDAVSMPKVRLGPMDAAMEVADHDNFRKIFEDKFKEQVAPKQPMYSIIPTPEGDALYIGHSWDKDAQAMTPDLEPLGQARPFREVLQEKYVAAEADKDPTLSTAAKVVAHLMDERGLSELPTYESTHSDSYFKDNGGMYNPTQPSILIRSLTPTADLRVGVHEGAHALFHSLIETNPEVKSTISDMMGFVFDKHFDDIEYGDMYHYGLQNEHEFISEAFSSKEFQKFLSTIEVPKEWLEKKGITFADGIKTVWDWFISTLQDAFGMEKTPENRTLLEAVLKYGEQLEAKAKEKGEAKGGLAFGPKEDVEAQLSHIRATVAGLDKKTFEQLQKVLIDRHKEDLAAALKRAEANQKKTQTKQWKAAAETVRKEVSEKIMQRPDVLADAMVGAGELAGTKLRQRYPLRADDLTPEQKAALPKHYYSKEGLPVDAVAGLFGYLRGADMVDDIIKFNQDRGNLTNKEHLAKVIEDETTRQMEWMHGKLDENIMRDAADQALSETGLNLIAEEWQAAAMQAGVQVVDRDVAKAEALQSFRQKRMGDVDFTRLQALMLGHYRKATDALINGDPATALVYLQRRYATALQAAEAKKLEKTQKSFDRTAKQFAKRDVPSADQEYTNWIHDVLKRVDKPVARTSHDLTKEITATGVTTFADFVKEKTGPNYRRAIDVWDQLLDPNWNKAIDDLTVEEFEHVNNSIKSLVWNAKDEKKIYKAGEAADLKEKIAEAVAAIESSAKGELSKDAKTKTGAWLKSYYINSLQVENIMNRFDSFDPQGTWNQFFMRDLIDGANQIDAWKKEYAKKFKELPTPKNLNERVDNPIFFDTDRGTQLPLTRKSLIAAMLNTGTGTGPKSNLNKLAKGYGLEPGLVMNWIHANATPEDWAFVRGIWDIFKDIKAKSDTMYRSISGGVPAQDLPTYPVHTPFGVVEGGYYPIIWDKQMEGKSRNLMGVDPLDEAGFFRAATPSGYTKERTGYVAPVSLELDAIPGRIAQMLQDVGLRPAVINAGKLMYSPEVRSAIRKHYGAEYRDMFEKYLESVANGASNMSHFQRDTIAASEYLRQNVITTLVGLNPGTVLKHGPSALFTSIREVGGKAFLKEVYGLMDPRTGADNWNFAIEHSLELQRRDRNWEETIYGTQHGVLTPGDKFKPWRQKVIEWSSKPVALSDMLSAVPTWLAEYNRQMEAGETHGDAVYMADRAVRRAHGSTAVTNRTGVMREWNPWLTSVYNFFSDIMNRQMEAIWKAGEIKGMVKDGDWKGAKAAMGGAIASMFAYAIWPAIVEHAVSGEAADEKEPWGETVAKAGLRTAASSWVGVRDVANWLLYGHDPQFGLAGTAMKEIGSVVNDLKKDHPFRKDHAGRLIQDGAGFIGALTGMMPQQIGRTARFVHDVHTGQERPKGPWAWLVGARFGTTKGHSVTFDNYMKGKVRK